MSLEISPAELGAKLRSENPPHLLDVRETDENQFAALPNSTLIPLGELPWRLEEIEHWKDRDVVVYCHHGMRSLQAISQMRQAGFVRLKNLAGGIDRWSLEVDPALPRY
jgi:rhodanese-related sulfurtransferase